MKVKNFAIAILFPNSNNEAIFKCIMKLFNQEKNNKSFLFHTYKDPTWLNELYMPCIDDILQANWSEPYLDYPKIILYYKNKEIIRLKEESYFVMFDKYEIEIFFEGKKYNDIEKFYKQNRYKNFYKDIRHIIIKIYFDNVYIIKS